MEPKNNIGIIHLSDSHFDVKNENEMNQYIEKLILDVKKVTHDNEFKIDFLCYTGDLIKSPMDISVAIPSILKNLKENLLLDNDKVFFIPGNHEVDISMIVESFEDGIENKLKNIDNINSLSNHEIEYINSRLSYIVFFRPFYEETKTEKQIKSYTYDYKDFTIGFCCINTSWFSKGKTESDIQKILINRIKLIGEFDKIKDCNVKICLMHHPIEWIRYDCSRHVNSILNEFDIVLSGHEHETSNNVIVHPNGRTLIGKAGECNPSDKNGYSIFKISTETVDCQVFHRKYYSTRRTFGPDLSINDVGEIKHILNNFNTSKQKLFEIYNTSRDLFYQKLDFRFIINLLDKKQEKTFDDLFIMPLLLKRSYYEKEKWVEEEQFYNFDEIFNSPKNLIFYGKKEIGKTTLAYKIAKKYYDSFQYLKKIPVIIDFKVLNQSGGIHFIEKEIIKQLETDNYKITVDEIKIQLDEGNFVLIFDNYNEEICKIDKIKEFINNYSKNRFIYFEEEKLLPPENEEEILELINSNIFNKDLIKIYLRPMSKNNIRQMVEKIIPDSNFETELFLDKLISYFYETNLPRTPFAVSLIITICNQRSDFIPVNQAKILEQFMEILLEKLSDETDLHEYDFDNKECYLSYLAYNMLKNNKFYFTEEEYMTLTAHYHEEKGFKLKDSRFDQLFFGKNILLKSDGNVYFRFECLIHYYLAKYASKNNNRNFYNFMISKDQYLNFEEEIGYYSGLVRNDEHLLDTIQSYLVPEIEKMTSEKYIISENSIKIEINASIEELREELKNDKLPVDLKDKLTDKENPADSYAPENITKIKQEEDYIDTFIKATTIFGNIIKNSEEININKKRTALNYFMNASCIQLSLLNKLTEENLKEMMRTNGKEIIIELLKNDKKEITSKMIKQYQNQLIEIILDVTKLVAPIVIQNIILDSVGTPKLSTIIKKGYDETSIEDPEKFMYLFLYCDLGEENWFELLKSYIKETKSNDMLKIILFKSFFYHYTDHFGEGNQKIEKIYIDVYSKLNHDKDKNQIRKDLKNRKRTLLRENN